MYQEFSSEERIPISQFCSWNFDVAGTIYSQAKPNEIVEGWKFLVNEGIPLIIYTNAFYTTSLFSWLYHSPNENVEVDEETVISNLLEPESLELRLCYWINKSRQIITDRNSFEAKFNEVRDSLRFENETEFKELLNRKLTIFGRIMKDVTIPLWERELNTKELVTASLSRI